MARQRKKMGRQRSSGTSIHAKGVAKRFFPMAESLQPMPDDGLLVESTPGRCESFADIELAIALGWGDTPQYKLPADWRTRNHVGPKPPRAR
jgi:hypothetical protein